MLKSSFSRARLSINSAILCSGPVPVGLDGAGRLGEDDRMDKNPSDVVVDCASDDGVTIGLIDAIMSISQVLVDRLDEDLDTESVREALKDLRSNPKVLFIVTGCEWKLSQANRTGS